MAFFTAIVSGLAVIFLLSAGDRKDDITGTISRVEPTAMQDGTPAHPYADANQCPPSTDLVVWPKNGNSIPSIPPEISVCFVGDQSFNNSAGPDVRVRVR